MMWKSDPDIEVARKHAGWKEFHRVCGKAGLFFDNPVREGRRGQYTVTAFGLTSSGAAYRYRHIADGHGKTVIAALIDAYQAADQPVADEWLPVLRDDPAAMTVDDDFDSLLGGDDFEELLG